MADSLLDDKYQYFGAVDDSMSATDRIKSAEPVNYMCSPSELGLEKRDTNTKKRKEKEQEKEKKSGQYVGVAR
jgi:cyclophilin family peptidyl-prolyl cis-trans isomerase